MLFNTVFCVVAFTIICCVRINVAKDLLNVRKRHVLRKPECPQNEGPIRTKFDCQRTTQDQLSLQSLNSNTGANGEEAAIWSNAASENTAGFKRNKRSISNLENSNECNQPSRKEQCDRSRNLVRSVKKEESKANRRKKRSVRRRDYLPRLNDRFIDLNSLPNKHSSDDWRKKRSRRQQSIPVQGHLLKRRDLGCAVAVNQGVESTLQDEQVDCPFLAGVDTIDGGQVGWPSLVAEGVGTLEGEQEGWLSDVAGADTVEWDQIGLPPTVAAGDTRHGQQVGCVSGGQQKVDIYPELQAIKPPEQQPHPINMSPGSLGNSKSSAKSQKGRRGPPRRWRNSTEMRLHEVNEMLFGPGKNSDDVGEVVEAVDAPVAAQTQEAKVCDQPPTEANRQRNSPPPSKAKPTEPPKPQETPEPQETKESYKPHETPNPEELSCLSKSQDSESPYLYEPLKFPEPSERPPLYKSQAYHMSFSVYQPLESKEPAPFEPQQPPDPQESQETPDSSETPSPEHSVSKPSDNEDNLSEDNAPNIIGIYSEAGHCFVPMKNYNSSVGGDFMSAALSGPVRAVKKSVDAQLRECDIPTKEENEEAADLAKKYVKDAVLQSQYNPQMISEDFSNLFSTGPVNPDDGVSSPGRKFVGGGDIPSEPSQLENTLDVWNGLVSVDSHDNGVVRCTGTKPECGSDVPSEPSQEENKLDVWDGAVDQDTLQDLPSATASTCTDSTSTPTDDYCVSKTIDDLNNEAMYDIMHFEVSPVTEEPECSEKPTDKCSNQKPRERQAEYEQITPQVYQLIPQPGTQLSTVDEVLQETIPLFAHMGQEMDPNGYKVTYLENPKQQDQQQQMPRQQTPQQQVPQKQKPQQQVPQQQVPQQQKPQQQKPQQQVPQQQVPQQQVPQQQVPQQQVPQQQVPKQQVPQQQVPKQQAPQQQVPQQQRPQQQTPKIQIPQQQRPQQDPKQQVPQSQMHPQQRLQQSVSQKQMSSQIPKQRPQPSNKQHPLKVYHPVRREHLNTANPSTHLLINLAVPLDKLIASNSTNSTNGNEPQAASECDTVYPPISEDLVNKPPELDIDNPGFVFAEQAENSRSKIPASEIKILDEFKPQVTKPIYEYSLPADAAVYPELFDDKVNMTECKDANVTPPLARKSRFLTTDQINRRLKGLGYLRMQTSVRNGKAAHYFESEGPKSGGKSASPLVVTHNGVEHRVNVRDLSQVHGHGRSHKPQTASRVSPPVLTTHCSAPQRRQAPYHVFRPRLHYYVPPVNAHNKNMAMPFGSTMVREGELNAVKQKSDQLYPPLPTFNIQEETPDIKSPLTESLQWPGLFKQDDSMRQNPNLQNVLDQTSDFQEQTFDVKSPVTELQWQGPKAQTPKVEKFTIEMPMVQYPKVQTPEVEDFMAKKHNLQSPNVETPEVEDFMGPLTNLQRLIAQPLNYESPVIKANNQNGQLAKTSYQQSSDAQTHHQEGFFAQTSNQMGYPAKTSYPQSPVAKTPFQQSLFAQNLDQPKTPQSQLEENDDPVLDTIEPKPAQSFDTEDDKGELEYMDSVPKLELPSEEEMDTPVISEIDDDVQDLPDMLTQSSPMDDFIYNPEKLTGGRRMKPGDELPAKMRDMLDTMHSKDGRPSEADIRYLLADFPLAGDIIVSEPRGAAAPKPPPKEVDDLPSLEEIEARLNPHLEEELGSHFEAPTYDGLTFHTLSPSQDEIDTHLESPHGVRLGNPEHSGQTTEELAEALQRIPKNHPLEPKPPDGKYEKTGEKNVEDFDEALKRISQNHPLGFSGQGDNFTSDSLDRIKLPSTHQYEQMEQLEYELLNNTKNKSQSGEKKKLSPFPLVLKKITEAIVSSNRKRTTIPSEQPYKLEKAKTVKKEIISENCIKESGNLFPQDTSGYVRRSGTLDDEYEDELADGDIGTTNKVQAAPDDVQPIIVIVNRSMMEDQAMLIARQLQKLVDMDTTPSDVEEQPSRRLSEDQKRVVVVVDSGDYVDTTERPRTTDPPLCDYDEKTRAPRNMGFVNGMPWILELTNMTTSAECEPDERCSSTTPEYSVISDLTLNFPVSGEIVNIERPTLQECNITKSQILYCTSLNSTPARTAEKQNIVIQVDYDDALNQTTEGKAPERVDSDIDVGVDNNTTSQPLRDRRHEAVTQTRPKEEPLVNEFVLEVEIDDDTESPISNSRRSPDIIDVVTTYFISPTTSTKSASTLPTTVSATPSTSTVASTRAVNTTRQTSTTGATQQVAKSSAVSSDSASAGKSNNSFITSLVRDPVGQNAVNVSYKAIVTNIMAPLKELLQPKLLLEIEHPCNASCLSNSSVPPIAAKELPQTSSKSFPNSGVSLNSSTASPKDASKSPNSSSSPSANAPVLTNISSESPKEVGELNRFFIAPNSSSNPSKNASALPNSSSESPKDASFTPNSSSDRPTDARVLPGNVTGSPRDANGSQNSSSDPPKNASLSPTTSTESSRNVHVSPSRFSTPPCTKESIKKKSSTSPHTIFPKISTKKPVNSSDVSLQNGTESTTQHHRRLPHLKHTSALPEQTTTNSRNSSVASLQNSTESTTKHHRRLPHLKHTCDHPDQTITTHEPRVLPSKKKLKHPCDDRKHSKQHVTIATPSVTASTPPTPRSEVENTTKAENVSDGHSRLKAMTWSSDDLLLGRTRHHSESTSPEPAHPKVIARTRLGSSQEVVDEDESEKANEEEGGGKEGVLEKFKSKIMGKGKRVEAVDGNMEVDKKPKEGKKKEEKVVNVTIAPGKGTTSDCNPDDPDCVCSMTKMLEDLSALAVDAHGDFLAAVERYRCSRYERKQRVFLLTDQTRNKRDAVVLRALAAKSRPQQDTHSTDQHKFVIVGGDVDIACLNIDQMLKIGANIQTFSWTDQRGNTLAGGHFRESLDGHLSIQHVGVKDEGVYTCWVTFSNPETDEETQRGFDHQLTVFGLPKYFTRVKMHYNVSVACDSEDVEVWNMFMPGLMRHWFCGEQSGMCRVGVDHPICFNTETGNHLIVNLAVHIADVFRLLKAPVDETVCNFLCRVGVQNKFVHLMHANLVKIVNTPVLCRLSYHPVEYAPLSDTIIASLMEGCEGGMRLQDNLCNACPADSFSTDESAECIKCEIGTYQPNRGSTQCLQCPNVFSGKNCFSLSEAKYLIIVLTIVIIAVTVSMTALICMCCQRKKIGALVLDDEDLRLLKISSSRRDALLMSDTDNDSKELNKHVDKANKLNKASKATLKSQGSDGRVTELQEVKVLHCHNRHRSTSPMQRKSSHGSHHSGRRKSKPGPPPPPPPPDYAV